MQLTCSHPVRQDSALVTRLLQYVAVARLCLPDKKCPPAVMLLGHVRSPPHGTDPALVVTSSLQKPAVDGPHCGVQIGNHNKAKRACLLVISAHNILPHSSNSHSHEFPSLRTLSCKLRTIHFQHAHVKPSCVGRALSER
jgi:hypothetical protein